MKRRLECPAELFVPLALLIPALAGQAGTVAAVAAACALGRLCTSCAAEAFRCAAAQEISPQRVRGAWSGALLATLTLSVAALSYVPARGRGCWRSHWRRGHGWRCGALGHACPLRALRTGTCALWGRGKQRR